MITRYLRLVEIIAAIHFQKFKIVTHFPAQLMGNFLNGVIGQFVHPAVVVDQ